MLTAPTDSSKYTNWKERLLREKLFKQIRIVMNSEVVMCIKSIIMNHYE